MLWGCCRGINTPRERERETRHRVYSLVPPAGGETIKNIKEQSCAHVELQRNPPADTDPNVRIFSLRGTPQQLDKARQLIDERVGVGIASQITL